MTSHRSVFSASLLTLALLVVLPAHAGSVGTTSSANVQVIEYYHAGLDHYFISASLSEQALLDSGVTGGWTRTGASFEAEAPTSSSAASPVCRFYGRPEVGLDSHFYSASLDECAAVARKFSASWIYESGNVFRIQMPNQLTGACQGGTVSVYRVFNNRVDANHRYTGDRTLRDQMVAAGHLPEGYGPDNVAFCAKATSSAATSSPSEPVPQAPTPGPTPSPPSTTPAPPSLPPC